MLALHTQWNDCKWFVLCSQLESLTPRRWTFHTLCTQKNMRANWNLTLFSGVGGLRSPAGVDTKCHPEGQHPVWEELPRVQIPPCSGRLRLDARSGSAAWRRHDRDRRKGRKAKSTPASWMFLHLGGFKLLTFIKNCVLLKWNLGHEGLKYFWFGGLSLLPHPLMLPPPCVQGYPCWQKHSVIFPT